MAKKLVKKQTGGVQDSSREFKIGKTTINTNKRTKPGDASFPSSTVKSVSISRNGKGVTFEKDKLGNGPYDKSISKFSTVKKKGGAIKKYQPGGPTFKKDSIQFRKDEKAYNANRTYQNEAKVVGAIKKYGTTKLTGKPTYKLSDMIMSDATKTKKKGGTVKSKKK
jgi:hypothetical protein